ncbi:MAG: Ig-like domain-containing protein, partial [Nanoarchaeota archaeon]
ATNVAQPVNEFYTGQKSIKITSNTGKFSVCELPIKVKENTKYILNAKFKCAPDSSAGHSGALFMGSFPYTNSQATKVLCSNQWQDISLTLNTVSSLTGLSYGMNIYGEFEDGPSTGGSSGSVLYDDLIVVDNILSPTATLLTPSATTNIPLNTKINIRFSKPMDKTTTQGVFALTTKDILNQDVQIPGTKTWKDYDRELEFTTSSPLQPNKTYTITITTTAKDKADKQLQTQFTSSFTTSLGTSTLSACATNGCSTENSRRCSLTSPTTTPQVCTKDNPTTPTCLKWVDQTVCAAPQTCQASTGQCGTPSTEICNNNIDDDNDGIYDGLDKDCATGEKVTIQSITVTDTKPFEEADFEIQCKIA